MRLSQTRVLRVFETTPIVFSRTLLAQTDLFSVSGKRVPTIAPPPPTDQAPDAVDDAISTPLDSPVTIAVLSNDTDPNLPNDTWRVTTVPQGAGGAVAINAYGTVVYTPGSTFSGVDSFQYATSYTVSDGLGGQGVGAGLGRDRQSRTGDRG